MPKVLPSSYTILIQSEPSALQCPHPDCRLGRLAEGLHRNPVLGGAAAKRGRKHAAEKKSASSPRASGVARRALRGCEGRVSELIEHRRDSEADGALQPGAERVDVTVSQPRRKRRPAAVDAGAALREIERAAYAPDGAVLHPYVVLRSERVPVEDGSRRRPRGRCRRQRRLGGRWRPTTQIGRPATARRGRCLSPEVLRLHEKGGKQHALPAHHKVEAYLDAYLEAGGIAAERGSPLWRSLTRSRELGERRMSRVDVFRMVKRRVKAAELGDAANYVPGLRHHGVSAQWRHARTRAGDRGP